MSDYDCVVGDVGKIYITTDTDKPVKLVFQATFRLFIAVMVFIQSIKGKAEY